MISKQLVTKGVEDSKDTSWISLTRETRKGGDNVVDESNDNIVITISLNVSFTTKFQFHSVVF